MTTTSKLPVELQSVVDSLEGLELPRQFQSKSTDDDNKKKTVDPELLEKYQHTRDEYLKRRMMRVFLEHVETFDHDTNAFSLPPPATAWHVQPPKVQQDIQAAVQKVHDLQTELQAKYAAFDTKRQQLQQMVREMELAAGQDDDDDMSVTGDDDEEIDDDALAEQQECLIALQQRRAALEAEIRTVDHENLEMQKSVQQGKKELADLIRQNETVTTKLAGQTSPTAIREILEDKNVQMEAEVARLEEIHEFYDSLVKVLEELGGIRILAVDQAPKEQSSEAELTLTVIVANEHKIRFDLKVDPRKRFDSSSLHENLKVIKATFLTPTLLQGPVRNDKGIPTVQLRIPDLSDLVQLADSLSPGDNLRFCLREAAARVRTLQARVQALTELLQTEAPVTKIDPIHETAFGGHDQEVICSLHPEQVSVLLRLTPDCPVVPGSVYVAQLVGLGGWDAAVLADIQQQVPAQLSSPVEVIRAVRNEIQKRRERDGLVLPATPVLPERRGE